MIKDSGFSLAQKGRFWETLVSMKTTRLLATLSMALATSATFAQSEIETLRARCAEQERQIRLLEDENTKLRSEASETQDAVSSAPLAASPALAATPATSPIYVVKAGDSWPKIASSTGFSPETIAKLNGLKKNSMIHPGQKLKLPSQSTSVSSQEVNPAPAPEASGKTHKIAQGDTFSSISRKYGISTTALIAANPTVKPSALRLGQLISLGAAAPAPATSAEAPAPANTTSPVESQPAAVVAPPAGSGKPIAVMIEEQVTYGEFAAKHRTDVERLNALNGLDLTEATVLAKGSELYVPDE
jgi:LysM repeat protein